MYVPQPRVINHKILEKEILFESIQLKELFHIFLLALAGGDSPSSITSRKRK